MSESQQDLWAQLARQAADEAKPVEVVLPREPLARRTTLQEKLAITYFSGFVPAFLTLLFGCLLALFQSPVEFPELKNHGALLLASGALVVLPLAWLTQGLWTVQQASSGRSLLLASLSCGLGMVLMVLPIAGFVNSHLKPMDVRMLVALLQDLYQAFLSPVSLLAAVLVGVLWWRAAVRGRRQLPWLEWAGTLAGWRVLSWLVLGSPWLALVGCALLQGHIAPSAQDFLPRLYLASPITPREASPWGALVAQLGGGPKLPETEGRLRPTAIGVSRGVV